MSEPEQSQNKYHKDYPTSQPFQSPYLAYAEESLGIGPSQQDQETARESLALESQPRSSVCDRTGFPSIQPAFDISRRAHIPQVTNWEPQHGPEGTRVSIYLSFELEADPLWDFHVLFATRLCSCHVTRLSNGPVFQLLITVEVPSLPASEWASEQVPLRIQIEDGSKNVLALKQIGIFRYTDIVHQPTPAPPASSKRPRDYDETGMLPESRKRSSSYCTRSFGSQPQEGLQAKYPFLQANPGLEVDSSIDNILSSYPREPRHPFHTAPTQHSDPMSAIAALPTTPARSHSPRSPAWSGVAASRMQQSRSPMIPGIATSGSGAMSTSSATPALVRTSTLHQSRSHPGSPAGASAPEPFNRYGIYPSHKATLRIDGDLGMMADDWNDHEQQAERRLVHFARSQSGSIITATFRPIAPDERRPNAICVSCIFCEADGRYYVTSVDIISLLEALVAVRFTVEEKNRIRRNLEGFKPLTVSKGKADTEDFFKVIMGFPEPKPRNIEKDVKVFPWGILAHALKKIIGKYSASWSSTASTIPGPPSAAGHGTAAHEPSADVYQDSALSTPVSTIDPVYSGPFNPPNVTSSAMHDQLAAPYTTAHNMMRAPYDISAYHAYSYAPPTSAPYAESYTPIHPLVATQRHPNPPQHPTGSWDFAFMNPPTSVPAGHTLYTSVDEDSPEAAQYHQMTRSSSRS